MKHLLCAQLWHTGRAPGQEDQSVRNGYDSDLGSSGYEKTRW